MQPDPIGLAGGMNLYGYANGDPVNYSDPFGLYAETQDETGQEDEGDPCKEDPSSSACKKQQERDSARACRAAQAQFVAAFVLDVALGVAYSSGAGLATRGALMMWEGFAIRQGLILTTTLKSAGSTGAAEMSLGRILAASGGAQVGGVALAIPDGFSFVPGMNSYNFVKSGGLDACSK